MCFTIVFIYWCIWTRIFELYEWNNNFIVQTTCIHKHKQSIYTFLTICILNLSNLSIPGNNTNLWHSYVTHHDCISCFRTKLYWYYGICISMPCLPFCSNSTGCNIDLAQKNIPWVKHSFSGKFKSKWKWKNESENWY